MTSPSEALLVSNAIKQLDRVHQLQVLRMTRLQEETFSESNKPKQFWLLSMDGMVTGATTFVAGIAFAKYYLSV